jgi:Ca2+-binding RTX toxin-like protein
MATDLGLSRGGIFSVFGSAFGRAWRGRWSGPHSLRRRRSATARVEGSVQFAELLECRRLYAVTASISNNVLVINGTPSAEVITVYQIDAATDQVFVDVDDTGSDLGPFAVTNFNSILLNGGDGADLLRVANSVNRPYGDMDVSMPAEIHGEAGNDSIWGSNQGDTLFGNQGSDELRDFDGNDVAYGGYGDLSDTAGNTFFGGTGNDSLFGGSGNDVFHTGDGEADFLNGGAGTSDVATDRDTSLDTTSNIEIL